MVQRLILVLLLVLVCFGCKKKTVQCSIPIYKMPLVRLGFRGFTPLDFNTIVVKRFQSGTSFSQMVDVDTLTCDSVTIDADVFIPACGNFIFGNDYDYEIYLPNWSVPFRLSNFTHPPETTFYWEAEERCGTRGIEMQTIRSVQVNDSIVAPERMYSSYPVIVLSDR